MFITENNLRTLIKSLLSENAKDNKALELIQKIPKSVYAGKYMFDIPVMGATIDEISDHMWGFVDTKTKDSFMPFFDTTGGKQTRAEKRKDNPLYLEFYDIPCKTKSGKNIRPLMISEIWMPLAAIKEGMGILLYELAAELSPDGIISSRNAVSGNAFKVWLTFLKNRSATIEKIPIKNCKGNDPWKTFSDKKWKVVGTDAKPMHGKYWKEEKFTRETHPLAYTYKSKRTLVYDTLKEMGMLLNDPPSNQKQRKSRTNVSQSEWDAETEWNSYSRATKSQKTKIAKGWVSKGYDKANTKPLNRWNLEDLK